MHYLDGTTDVAQIVDSLQDLQKQGKIRWFGLSNISKNHIPDLMPYRGNFATIQNQYSLACRDQEHTIQALQHSLSVTPLTWGSLGQGILTGKYDQSVRFDSNDRRSRSTYPNFHGEKLIKNLEIVEILTEIAYAHNTCISAVAIRFILDYLAGSCVLCGAKRPDQVLQNAQAMNWHLTKNELDLLTAVSG